MSLSGFRIRILFYRKLICCCRHVSSDSWEVRAHFASIQQQYRQPWKTAFTITAIKGMGQRYTQEVLKKADINVTKRMGELTEDEVECVITIVKNPWQYKIPDWFLNRQKNMKDENTAWSWPKVWTTSFRKIWSSWRRCGSTEGCATSEVFMFEASTPRPPAAKAALELCPRNKPVGSLC